MVHVSTSFNDLELPPVDDVFIALGTTIKLAGSRAAFRAVDLHAVVAVASAARTAGAKRLGVVSAMSADASSKVFYNRVKGEMEAAVTALGFEAVVIVRPSLLAGDRETLAQSIRPIENIFRLAAGLFKFMIFANYRPVQGVDVAEALVNAVQAAGMGTRVMLSSELQPQPEIS